MKLEDAFELKLAHEQERAAVGAGEVSDGRQEAVEALVAAGIQQCGWRFGGA